MAVDIAFPQKVVDMSSTMVDVSTRGVGFRMAENQWLDEREARAWRSFRSVQMQLEVGGRQLADESDLSFADDVVLVALTDQPDDRIRLFGFLGETIRGWKESGLPPRRSHDVTRLGEEGDVRVRLSRCLCRRDRQRSHGDRGGGTRPRRDRPKTVRRSAQ